MCSNEKQLKQANQTDDNLSSQRNATQHNTKINKWRNNVRAEPTALRIEVTRPPGMRGKRNTRHFEKEMTMFTWRAQNSTLWKMSGFKMNVRPTFIMSHTPVTTRRVMSNVPDNPRQRKSLRDRPPSRREGRGSLNRNHLLDDITNVYALSVLGQTQQLTLPEHMDTIQVSISMIDHFYKRAIPLVL